MINSVINMKQFVRFNGYIYNIQYKSYGSKMISLHNIIGSTISLMVTNQ